MGKKKAESEKPTEAAAAPEEPRPPYRQVIKDLVRAALIDGGPGQDLGIPLLLGDVGVGKNHLAEELAHELGWRLQVTILESLPWWELGGVLVPPWRQQDRRRREALVTSYSRPPGWPWSDNQDDPVLWVLDEFDKAEGEVITPIASLCTSRECHGHRLQPGVRMLALANEFVRPLPDFVVNRMLWFNYPEPGREQADVEESLPTLKWLAEGLVGSRPARRPARVVSKRTFAYLGRWIQRRPDLVFSKWHQEVLVRALFPDNVVAEVVKRLQSSVTTSDVWEAALRVASAGQLLDLLPRLLWQRDEALRAALPERLYTMMREDPTNEKTLAVLAVLMLGAELQDFVDAPEFNAETLERLRQKAQEIYTDLQKKNLRFVYRS
ncbi:MAG: AAA family ATPase [Armatimonadota bacterium]|nr:AAA family ATPase [Armatimonadota bacterium]MDR7559499.1 AAA family ATPase [Armatimonadota bacterium]